MELNHDIPNPEMLFLMTLERKTVMDLAERLKVSLPDIPPQSQKSFFHQVLYIYEAQIEALATSAYQLLLQLKLLPELNFSKVITELGKLIEEREKSLLIEAIKYAELEIANLTDSLTQLWNKRAFDKFLEDKLHWLQRSDSYWIEEEEEREIVLIFLIDIDDFKSINDLYGHQGGDSFLQQLAQNLQSIAKHGDLAIRWAGDEFALIFTVNKSDLLQEHDESMDKAIQKFSEGIHHRIASTGITLNYEGGEIVINPKISIGVAKLTPESNSREVVSQVDEKLYASKTSGKNQVVFL